MSAGTYNFVLEQGTDHTFTVTYTDGAGVPISITDFDFTGSIKLQMSDTEVFAYFDFEKIDPANGVLKVKIPSYETSGKRLKSTNHDDYVNAVYDIEFVDTSNGDTQRLLHGSVKISPEVTR